MREPRELTIGEALDRMKSGELTAERLVDGAPGAGLYGIEHL